MKGTYRTDNNLISYVVCDRWTSNTLVSPRSSGNFVMISEPGAFLSHMVKGPADRIGVWSHLLARLLQETISYHGFLFFVAFEGPPAPLRLATSHTFLKGPGVLSTPNLSARM